MDFTAKQLHALQTLLETQRKAIAEDTHSAIETSRKEITRDTQLAIEASRKEITRDTQLAIKDSESKVIERIDILENNLLQVMEDIANTYTHQDDFAKLTERVTKLEQH